MKELIRIATWRGQRYQIINTTHNVYWGIRLNKDNTINKVSKYSVNIPIEEVEKIEYAKVDRD